MPWIVGYLDEKVYGPDVVAAVALFLSTVTEDQGDVDYSASLKSECLSKLLSADGGSNDSLLKTLAAIILLNLNQQSFNAGKSFMFQIFLAIL